MISQKKLAEKLGMPVSTVANILHGTPRYKPDTRDRVLKAAKEWGYRPNRACLSIRRGRSNLIGIVYFDASSKTSRDAVAAVRNEVVKLGYNYLVINVDWHERKASEILEEILQMRAEGMILIGDSEDTFNAESLEMLKKVNTPVVSLWRDTDLNVPSIGSDAEASFFSLTRHLQEIGHQSILFPICSLHTYSSRERMNGFKAAIDTWGTYYYLSESEFSGSWPKLLRRHRNDNMGVILALDDKDRISGDHPIRIGEDHYALAKTLFTSGAYPNALMCSNDRAAAGVFNAAYEMKVRIPEDMAVTGSDNEDFGEFSMFRLTSIRLDTEYCTRAIVHRLHHILKKHPLEKTPDSFPAELVLRQSCGRICGLGENPTVLVKTRNDSIMSRN